MLNWSPGLTGGPDLFPGKPGRPAPLFGAVVVCARAAGAPTTVPIKRTAASVVILFMVCLHWMPDQSFGGSLVKKMVEAHDQSGMRLITAPHGDGQASVVRAWLF